MPPLESKRAAHRRRSRSALGLAILGLILVEQLIRRAHPAGALGDQAAVHRAGRDLRLRPVLLRRRACCSAGSTPNIWIARGVANALVIPFIAVATARNTGWTIEMHVSRSAVFHSTAILVSGLFLLLVAGAGYFVALFGGEWGRALQIELFVRRAAGPAAGRYVGPLPVASCASSSASISFPIATTIARNGCASRARWRPSTALRGRPGARHQGAGRPGRESRRRAVAAGTRTTASGRRRAGTCRRSTPWSRRDGIAAAIPAAHRVGHRPGRIRGSTRRATRSSCCRTGCRRLPSAWLVVPLVSGADADRLRRACHAAGRDRGELGGPRPAQDGEPAGGELSSARSARPRRCSRRASSTPSTACRHLSSTT